MTQLSEKAEALRRLHAGPRVLVLANAWDAASARLVEAAGFPAIATSSAGVAFALGHPDGERITRAEMLEMVRRIARVVKVPVTADVEAGYGSTAEAAAETARAVAAWRMPGTAGCFRSSCRWSGFAPPGPPPRPPACRS